MNTEAVIEAFDQLGILINELIHWNYTAKHKSLKGTKKAVFDAVIKRSCEENTWYTLPDIYHKLAVIEKSIRKEKLAELVIKYKHHVLYVEKDPLKVAYLLKETSPVSGFNELLVTLLSGKKFILKSLPDENLILRFCADMLVFFNPELSGFIEFREGIVKGFNAIVTNSKSEVLHSYFSKYKNHTIEEYNPVAIITGEESTEELTCLGKDIFTYFGRSSDNVDNILVPEDYDFTRLFDAFSEYKYVSDNFNYYKHYESHKSIMLIGKIDHLDNGFLLITDRDNSIKGTGVLNYQKYHNMAHLRKIMESLPEESHKVKSTPGIQPNEINFGDSTLLSFDQHPYVPRLFRFLNELTPIC
jgi:hypothetical protein